MSKINAVAIERQYCSGGSEIGKRVGEMLGIPCYDREIVELAAERLGITSEEIRKFEEWVISPIKAQFHLRRENQLDMFEKVFAAETEIIAEYARRGPCVIVGRCAGYILKNITRTLKVYICATAESRTERAVSEHHIAFDDADNVLKRYDKKRGDFFNVNTRQNWSSMLTYDICLNSSALGVEGCARTICDMVRASGWGDKLKGK